MKGRWATGIPPRNFQWVIRDRLAVSERPGGFSPNHRRVRRKEEIVWLRTQGFTRVISLLASPHNLRAYEDEAMEHAHYPLAPKLDPRQVLSECYQDLERSLDCGLRILVHHEELGDRVMGAAAGFLVWSGRLPTAPQAIVLLERLIGHRMGSEGRELVVTAAGLPPRRQA